MSTLTEKDLIENIRNSLNLDKRDEHDTISESYVAQEKNFNLSTELLSDSNKKNHVELYQKYIEDFNRISAELDTANRDVAGSNSSQYRSLKIDETYNLNAIYLHELYFSNISDLHSQISKDSLSYMRLSRDFGTFDAWQKDFMSCALSSRCGWAITYLNFYTQSYMNCFIDLHSKDVPAGMYPVIVMDMWQHAYYKDYLKDSKTYLVAMMKQLRWPIIEKRIEKADKILQVLREG